MAPSTIRFAPSPNGYLHIGHALSAAVGFAMAQRAGGRFLVRIEDIDATRCRPQFEAAILDDLCWLALTWDGPVRRQSDHMADYAAALARLDALGLIYPGFESRGEINRMVLARESSGPWPRDPDGAPLYPGDARRVPLPERAGRIQAGEPHALRLDMKAALRLADGRMQGAALSWIETGAGPEGQTGTVAAEAAQWGDVILARKDVPTSYHLAVVCDDAIQGVTHVVRGQDLFRATGLHRLLQVLLDLPQPAYHHHRLLLDRDGRKLSKSTGATSLRELRAQGLTAAEVRAMIGCGRGQEPQHLRA